MLKAYTWVVEREIKGEWVRWINYVTWSRAEAREWVRERNLRYRADASERGRYRVRKYVRAA